MYVAITRAKERLFLTYAATRFLYGERKRTLPSRFLAEMGYEKPKGNPADGYAANAASVGGGVAFLHKKGISGTVPGIIPPNLPRNDRVPVAKFQVGTRVSHRKFGLGVIASVSGTPDNCYAEIDFEQAGRLNLSLNYAPLEVNNDE